ncbi:MAG: glycosyltransferase family 39 protein [Saprospiraceae bacterium]
MIEANWISRQPLWTFLALVFMAMNALLLFEMNPDYPFYVRFPGVVLLFAGLGLGYEIGRRFFGKETMLFALLVAAGSWLLPNAAKWVSLDAWLWLPQLLTALGMLGFLKQPDKSWKWLVWLSWPVALLLHPLGSLLGVGGLYLVWRSWHPSGKRLDQLGLYLIGPLVAALSLWLNMGERLDGWYLLTTDWKALAGQLLGILPWLGFVVAGLVETIRNFRKGEELAILMAGLLAGAILANSLWLQWVLALIAAKQLQRFILAGYPYGNVVKTIAVLQLVAYILIGIGAMMYGYGNWGGSGFRAAMNATLACWAPALFGVFGLFGENQRMAVLGFMFSGLLFSLAFWTQLYPLIYG